MTRVLSRFSHRFRQQAAIAAGYSPCYQAIWKTLALWCEAPEAAADPLVRWLLDAAAGRRSLEVSLLLVAGLHDAVLRGELPALANYFLTAGGTRPVDDDLPAVLRAAILASREPLEAALQEWQVQTNETGRGLVWLLPLAILGWPAVDLLDLGASAGLNLLADRRRYDLLAAASGRPWATLGSAPAPQFTVRCEGQIPRTPPFTTSSLRIRRRRGFDLAPFTLETPEDETRLMSFIWPDQPERMARLREGLAALRALRDGGEDLALAAGRLPAGLPAYLEQRPADALPLVIYNTYITQYFYEEAPRLRQVVEQWAARQSRPVLWIQWEPPEPPAEPPHFAWCAWTVDLWQEGRHRQERLGWVHPHGHHLILDSLKIGK